jgi:hypothetical protein
LSVSRVALTIAVLATLVGAGSSAAAAPQAAPAPPDSKAEPDAARPRPGLIHVGPFYITPTFRLGSFGVDTNVFYTPTDRQTDLTASGGPGLEIVLPIREPFRLVTSGTVNYLYFLRTRSQRRFSGSALGRLEAKGGRTEVSLQEAWVSSYGRPSYEVDRRIVQTQEATTASLRRRMFGRTTLAATGERSRAEVPPGETFLGVDLARTLSDNVYRGELTLEYALTAKTAFLVNGSRELHHFPSASVRNGHFDTAKAGFRTTSITLLSGMVLAGVGRFHFDATPAKDRDFATAVADVTWHVSHRTRLGGSYERRLAYTAFDTVADAPVVRLEIIGGRVEKELWGRRIDVRLTGTITRYVSDTPISIISPDGSRHSAVRDDTVRTALGHLGYHFRSHLRIGISAGYTARSSVFSDLGVKGLILGGTLNFSP